MGLARNRWWLAASVFLALGGMARAEGPGIKLGDRLVLHPGLAVEFRYDSNVFFENSNTTGAGLFRLMPSIDLATRPAQRGGDKPHLIDFRLHTGIDYNEYLTNDAFVSSHRSVGVQAGGLLTILPYYPFTIDLFDHYVRSVQPPYGRLPYNLDRDTNEAGVRFRIRPGGGRLEFDVGYTFGIDFFEPLPLQDLNVMTHKANFRATWKFFPKTAIYIDVSEQPILYQKVGTTHPNSYPLRAIAGLTGLITTKLTLNAWIGYGNGFYVTGPSPNTAIGGVDVKWKPTMLSQGTLGYKHDFVNSLLGSYYDLDMAYISWMQMIWRFTGSISLNYSNIRYQGIPMALNITPLDRVDNYITLDLRVDYPFKNWLIGSVGYVLQYNNSNAVLGSPMGAPALGVVPVDYLKNEVWLRLAVLY